MYTNLSIIVSVLITFIVLVLAAFIIHDEYTKEPAKRKLAIKQQNHDAMIKAIQIIKGLAKSEIINASKDEDLPTGQAKNNKVVKDIMEALHIAGLNNIPEVIVIRIVEATYQTIKGFIKDNHLDSRAKTTPLPSDMNPNELKKRLP